VAEKTGFYNNWKGEVFPKAGSTVSSNATVDPYAGFRSNTGTGAVDQQAVDIYSLTNDQRKELAKLLKDAGYKVPVTGVYSKTLADAYTTASQEAALQSARLGRAFSVGDFLTQESQARIAAGSASGQPTAQRVTRVADDTTAAGYVNKLVDNLLGRPATPKEVSTYSKKLQAAQKKNPTVTTYVTRGGITNANTTGGIDEDQFLTDLITKTPEFVKRQKTAPEILNRNQQRLAFETQIKGMTPEEMQIASDNTDYGRGLADTKARLDEAITELGATATPEELDALAKKAYDSAIENNPALVRQLIRSNIKYDVNAQTKGEAGKNIADLRKTAAANGIDLDKAFGSQLQSWLQNINKGESVDTYKQIIRNVAKIGLPEKVASLIDQGVDLDTLYSPYKNIMASTLEINPQSITLNDPTLRSAISADKEVPIYEFERQLRKDQRWQYTNQAKEEVSNIALKVLRDFGFQG